jgi:hypothetical protein
MKRGTVFVLAAGLLVALATSGGVVLNGQGGQASGTITGVVASEKGPEAGVWVIAETRDLPTSLRKIVVTGDDGKFLLPELPRGNYEVFARGYGLVDSPRVKAALGQDIKLAPTVAKTPQEEARIYPGPYWFSMMKIPAPTEFPGTGPEGNGISTAFKTVEAYNHELNECVHCHTLGGTEWTRTQPPNTEKDYTSSVDMWDKRVRMGQRASEMNNVMTGLGRQRALQMFADWTDRIAKGEVPAVKPARPAGVERNVVITSWEWGTTMTKIHDITATDKRNPRVSPNSPVYGTDIARDYLSILDPVSNSTRELYIPTLEDRRTWQPNYQQSGYISRLGTLDRFNPTNIHNPMKDAGGRVWYTANLRPANLQPAWCKEGSSNKFAQYFPLARSGRNVSFYDPATDKFTMIDTCSGTHHLQFGFDDQDTLFFSGGGAAYSWIRTKQFLATGDGQASQGWCPTVVDTNGDGRITKPWNEPRVGGGEGEEGGGGASYANFDPKKDTRVTVGAYGIIVNPVDGSVWGANTSHPGKVLRLDLGNNPPETCIAEVYSVPSEAWGATGPNDERGSKPRGIDIDRNGVIWTALSASGHLASFDRRKCQGAKGGPEAHTGQHCLEGWTLYPLPGSPPHMGTRVRGTDFYYFNYVDQFNTLGLGDNIPIAMGSASDSIYPLVNGKPLWFRVPYPMGAFFPRGVDGRIDDPNAGWKGRGVYSGSAQDTVWHSEGAIRYENGKWIGSQRPMIVKFQVRPNPLAN